MKIAIVGVGLIGGSIALNLRSKTENLHFIGIDKSPEHQRKALERGIIDETSTLEEGLEKAELIILSIPVDETVKLLPKILDLIGEKQTLVDVGSTKFSIVNCIKDHPKRSRFVAFHPMWGVENFGPDAATQDSFYGKAAVICDQENSATDAVDLVTRMADHLGMHVLSMTAEEHDIHAAYISHISHISSYALANTVLEKEKEEDTIFQLASSGFSSTVRLAKSHSEMWAPIFLQNKENILDVLQEHILQLQKLQTAIAENNELELRNLIANANRIRKILK